MVKMNMNKIQKNFINKPASDNEEAPAGDYSSDDSGLPSEFEDDDAAVGRPGQKRNYSQANAGGN